MTRTMTPSGERRGAREPWRAAALVAPGGAVRRLAGSVWIWPMAVMAVAGGLGINGPIMWRDELASWSAASRSLPQLWHMVHDTDAVQGTYYLVLHFWIMVFGASPAAMRAPSVIAMTGAAGVVALTGRRLGGPVAGLGAGLVFALIPIVSRFAQEARPYAFATFFAALATLLLLRALERSCWQRWLPYGLALAATGVCNVLALCLIAGHAVVIAAVALRSSAEDGGRRRDAPLWFALCALAAVAIDSPIIIEGHSQTAEQIGTLQRPDLSQLTGLDRQFGVWPELFCSAAVAVAVIVLAAASLTGPAARRRAGAFCLVNALVPTVVLWAASQGPTSYWLARYLLFTVPAWAVAAGLGIARIGLLAASPRGRMAVLAAGLVLIGLLAGPAQLAVRQPEAHNWWSYPDPVGDVPADYQAAASVIAAGQRPGDGIVYQVSDDNHWMPDTGIGYYLRGRAKPADVFQARTPAQAGGFQPVECRDPASCLRGAPRLWVVYVNHLVPGGHIGDPYAAIEPGQASLLRAKNYVLQRLYEEHGITVALMVAR